MGKAFEEIAQVIGEEAAANLCLHLGGVHAYVSNRGVFRKECLRIIGVESWRRLHAVFKGGGLDIPMAAKERRELRDKAIVKDWQGGLRERDLVIKYRVSGRCIRCVKKRYRDNQQRMGT